MASTDIPDRVNEVKRSFKTPFDPSVVPQELYDNVLRAIAHNVKMGPFKATSGVELPYYLNASTNFLDKSVAPNIVELFIRYINHYVKPSTDGPFLLVGMEVAGGMLVSQLASANNKDLNERADFVYMRKHKKSTGTKQQLEGPKSFTSRDANSPLLKAVWIDDSLSTGTSMLEGMQLLKEHYNIQVVAALYLVDRSEDRKNIPDSQQKLADKTIDDVDIYAIYDLQDVDQLINEGKE